MTDKLSSPTDKLSRFKPSTKNANAHKPRGLKLLADAMSESGYVAPITVAADGETLDGSARLEVAFETFGDKALVIHHDGQTPIIMVRDDIPNAHTPEAKKIAVAANRIGQVDLAWDAAILDELKTEIDLGDFWTDEEWRELLETAGNLDHIQFREYDESIENEVKYIECPNCHHKFPNIANHIRQEILMKVRILRLVSR